MRKITLSAFYDWKGKQMNEYRTLLFVDIIFHARIFYSVIITAFF